MHAESLSFDPTCQQDEWFEEKGLLQNHATTCGTNLSMGVELQQQLNLEMGKFHSSLNCNDQNENNLMQEFGHEPNNTGSICGHSNWGEMSFNPYNQQLSFPISSLISNPSNFIANTDMQKSSSYFTPSLGLLGGFQRTELASTSTNIFYDPQLNMPMNICTPQQPSLFKDLFHLSPHGSYGLLGSSGTGSLFSHGVAEEEVTGALYHDGSFHEFSGDINSASKKREGKDIKHHASEKQRRVHFSDKFQALRTLIPDPSKNDRATIIADAIGYINELKMRVSDLKNKIDLKKERIKRQRVVEDGCNHFIMDAGAVMEVENQVNKSCYQRKSKNTEVDVRVVEDEVTVKFVQHEHKRVVNCLLFVSKALDELQLDLHYVAGGLIGDHHSYLFNSKICEGCTVYASAIANKVFEVLEKENADNIAPASCNP